MMIKNVSAEQFKRGMARKRKRRMKAELKRRRKQRKGGKYV
jgi:hypothetical protein